MEKSVKLNNGILMPLVGYGVYEINDNDECEKCVLDALEIGYRLIDTAEFYKNEIGIGNAIKKTKVPREQIFLITKVWIKNFKPNETKTAVLNSLKKLQTSYIDLVLIHWPKGDYYSAWRELQDLYKQKIVRAIGVSNFSPERLLDLIRFNEICPAVNQIETNVFLQMHEANVFMNKYNVVHQAWSPLAKKRLKELIEHPLLIEIGKKYNKSSTQIALKFNIQRNIAIIPKTINKQRMIENINIYDFELTENDINSIKKIDETNITKMHWDKPEFVDYLLDKEF
ncbi:aldo/keto reductase [Mycoplasmoides pirum]|uniref:aldo/keto reductase n=1 Tax=Mycoplasmoides pirum TaxID=2122 RepID=UPI00055D92EB|nr:aldo/keto reductase [Mycoplasmoides pirum]